MKTQNFLLLNFVSFNYRIYTLEKIKWHINYFWEEYGPKGETNSINIHKRELEKKRYKSS
jgi:hypothetical protein